MSPGAVFGPLATRTGNVDALLAKQGKADKLQLRRRIEFRLATQTDAKQDLLRKKYQPINDASARPRKSKAGGAHKTAGPGGASGGLEDCTGLVESSGFRRAAHSLFPAERLATGWRTIRPIGPGLNNLGNTCFLNSVLQCLTYTPPLAEYLLTREHSDSCRAGDNCMLCRFEAHVQRALSKREGAPISPKAVVGRLKIVAKHMRIGRQEDAHEFLRLLVDAFQRSLLAGIDSKIDRRILETTLAHQIFGGYLQSQVSCGRCGHDSNTFDPLLDISLDVQSGSTIAKALRSFTRPETLTKDNRYRCERCNKLVDATKQMTVYRLPRILTLQLKRFSAFGGGKIGRYVEFPPVLNMKSYISKNSSETGPYDYNLYAVLVHAGGSARSGHYYCYAKSPAGIWHELNDSSVRQVSERTVLQQKAYLLFYERSASPPRSGSSTKSAKKSADKPATNGHSAPKPAPSAVLAASDDMETALTSRPPQQASKGKKDKKDKKDKKKAKRSTPASESSKPVPESAPEKAADGSKPEAKGPEEEPAPISEPSSVLQEWVVRSKSSAPPPPPKPKGSSSSSSSSAPVVRWDEDAGSKQTKAAAVAETKRVNDWSIADVRADRRSQYGVQVESWTGGVSASSTTGEKAKKRQYRPDWYDAEYDRGRVKKIKKPKRNRFAATANPFQTAGERLSKSKRS